MRKILLYAAAVLTAAGVIILLWPPSAGNSSRFLSKRIYDRNGVLIRELLSDEEGVSKWVSIDSLPEYTKLAFIIKEDRNFEKHWGVDYPALLRSAVINLKKGRIVSGASTITMQVSRMTYPIKSYPVLLRKILEIFIAGKMEMWKDKEQILETYLNRMYFGNMIHGIESASIMYFGKSAVNLSIKESAILACIPQAPSLFNPYVSDELEKRADGLIDELQDNGIISAEQCMLAKKEEPDYARFRLTFNAPHFTDMVLALQRDDEKCDIYTTLDLNLQKYIQDIVSTTLLQFADREVNNAAVMIMDAQNGDILAMCGSADYFNDEIGGKYNAVFGIRSPGSALKPFTYALALMNGYNASSIIIDEPVYFKEPYGDYKPENYDKSFHGPVSLRRALACSYNVPAVILLNSIGYTKLYELLMKLDFPAGGKPEQYGLAITLGSYCVRLYDLVRAYSVFPNLGIMTQPRMFVSDSVLRKEAIPEYSAYIISDILSDNEARAPAFNRENPFKLPFFAGVKTGTSKNYKDNFAIGFTERYIIGVWVGNNNQRPMQDVSGITGAGALFRNIVIALREMYDTGSRPVMPSGVKYGDACALSGQPAGPYCRNTFRELFRQGVIEQCGICAGISDVSRDKAYIDYPDEGDIFVPDNDIDRENQKLTVRIKGAEETMIVKIDEQEYSAVERIIFQLEKGAHTISLYDSEKVIDRISFEVR